MASGESIDHDLVGDSAGPGRDAIAIVSVLNHHRVDYIVIGAYAAIAQRAPIDATRDADLDDVIRSKELAGRPKDLRVLPALYRHQASRRTSESPPDRNP